MGKEEDLVTEHIKHNYAEKSLQEEISIKICNADLQVQIMKKSPIIKVQIAASPVFTGY